MKIINLMIVLNFSIKSHKHIKMILKLLFMKNQVKPMISLKNINFKNNIDSS